MQHYQFRNSEFHLSPDEIRRLIDSAPTLRDRMMVMLLAFTGIRRAEVRSLKKSDIDSNRRRLLIRLGKGGKQRIVFLPVELVKALDSYCRILHTAYLFPGRKGQQMSLRNVNYILARVGERAGVYSPNPRYVNVGAHLLRHSLARNWKRAGGSLESLQKILGHASLKTTLDIYGTESQEDTEQNYRCLENQLVGSFPTFDKL